MDVEIFQTDGASEVNPETYDYIFRKAGELKNKNYQNLKIEFSRSMLKDSKTILGDPTDKIILNFGGIQRSGTRLVGDPVSVHDVELYTYSEMDQYGWKPISFARRGRPSEIICYVKPPYILCTMRPQSIRPTNLEKRMLDRVFREMASIGAVKYQNDIKGVISKFSAYMKTNQQKEYKSVCQNITSRQQQINSLSDDLHNEYERLRNDMKNKRIMEMEMKKDVECEYKFKTLMNIEGVKAIDFDNDTGMITIITNPLVATISWNSDDKDERPRRMNIGSFRISWGPRKHVRIENLDKHPDNEYDHPHVHSENPCWGNMDEIEDYAAKMEVEVATQLILTYLTVIYPYDSSIGVKTWNKNWNKKPSDEWEDID